MSILTEEQPKSKAQTLENFKIKALLIGASGTGTTTGAMTLPGRKLLIDTDGRAESVQGFDNVTPITISEPTPDQPKAWFALEKLRTDIWSAVRQNKFVYDSVIVDGISSMCRYAINWSLMLTGADNKLMSRGPGGGPAQPHYMPAMFKIDRFINSMLALPLNVVFTTHEELFEDKHLKTLTFYPKITGKLRTELANWFNESYLTTTIRGSDGKTKYLWQTQGGGDRRPFMKSSLNQLGRYWIDPVEIKFDKELRGFELLIEKRFGKKQEPLTANKPTKEKNK